MYTTNRFTYSNNYPVSVYELNPTGQKSYYGKAKVIETDTCEIYLQSYNTIVCVIDATGKFKRLWSGYSATTMKHINDFLRLFGLNGGGKKWWTNLAVENGGM